jgi:hypothetical protein
VNKVLAFIKEKPRVVILGIGIIVQILELFAIKVPSGLVENCIDLVTLFALGRVMQKSETDKVV